MKMNPEVKEMWTKALDTKELPDGTKITQTKDNLRLKTSGGRRPLCCLGVLSEIAVLEGVIPAPTTKNGEDFTWTYENDNGEIITHEDEDLSPAVIAWAGLKPHDSNPAVQYETDTGTYVDALSVLNDDRLFSFKQISDIIKENL